MPSKETTLYSNGGHPYTLGASFEQVSVDAANNTRTLSCAAYLIALANYWSTDKESSVVVYWHDNHQNTDVFVSILTFKGMSEGETKTTIGSITVPNNDDGTLSGYAYAYFNKGSTTSSFAPNSGGVATDWTVLTPVDRYPMITTAPNFTDEENPTITYTTNVGFENAKTYACISLDGNTDNIAYREINISNGNYTFNLTEAERNVLRNATPDSNTLNVMFFLKTTAGGNNYYSSLARQMTIINANPTLSYTITETNQKVINLLGTNNANTLIKLASKLNISSTFTTKKYSTAKKINIKEGTDENVIQTFTAPTPTSPYSSILYVSGYPNSGKIIITLTDSRDNYTSKIDNARTILDYTNVKVLNYNFKRLNPTSSNIILNAEFTYLKNIGSYNNTPIVSWKLEDGSFTTIPSSNYTIDTANNKLTITNYEIANILPYTTQGQFYIKIEDLLTEAQDGGNKGLVLKGIPTYDEGEHDLQVNGDLFVADINGENAVNILETLNGIKGKVLWTNQNPSSTFTSQTITLNSDDYDLFEIIYSYNTSNLYTSSVRGIKGKGVLLTTITTNGAIRRIISYISDTSLSVESIADNDSLIPLYVIGYKTGIF